MPIEKKKVYYTCGQCRKTFCGAECPHCEEETSTPPGDSMFGKNFFEEQPGHDGIYYEEESVF